MIPIEPAATARATKTIDDRNKPRQQVTTPQVRIFNSFKALHEALELLPIELTAEADIFCTLPWLENLARHGLELPLNSSPDLRLVLVEDTINGFLMALPFLSNGLLSSLSNYYSSLYGPVVWSASHPRKSEAAQLSLRLEGYCYAICRQLRADPTHWPSIMLSPLDAESPFFDHMHAALTREGYWVDRFFCFGNWYLQVEGRSFDDYQKTLPSALRNSLVRGQKRLTKQGTGTSIFKGKRR